MGSEEEEFWVQLDIETYEAERLREEMQANEVHEEEPWKAIFPE